MYDKNVILFENLETVRMIVMGRDNFMVEGDYGKINAGRGLFLKLILNNGKEKMIPVGRIFKSRKVVKTITREEYLWCDIHPSKDLNLEGMTFSFVKSFSLVLEENGLKKWSVVNGYWVDAPKENAQAEFIWITCGVDSTTHRLILRVERVGGKVIAYGFFLC